METILKLDQIHKNYGKKEVLKGVSLDVQKGEIISVLGPSGCGKSTLLNIIAGILPINSGHVLLNCVEVTSPNKIVPIEKRDLNMVFQDFALWPHMTARENILYGLKLRKATRQEQEENLQKMVDLLHLNGLMDQYPAELSGGQQQRVAIARALIMSPSIILLDEPLCNLDVQLRIEMRTEMAQIFRELKTTVFHVTHGRPDRCHERRENRPDRNTGGMLPAAGHSGGRRPAGRGQSYQRQCGQKRRRIYRGTHRRHSGESTELCIRQQFVFIFQGRRRCIQRHGTAQQHSSPGRDAYI